MLIAGAAICSLAPDTLLTRASWGGGGQLQHNCHMTPPERCPVEHLTILIGGPAALVGHHKTPEQATPPGQLTSSIPPQPRLGCYSLLQSRWAAYKSRRLEVQGLGGQGGASTQLLQLLGPARECGNQLAV